MIGHHLRLVLRHMRRNRVYWSITIAGFSLGLFAALVISLYVYDDMIYDQSLTDSGQIYRLYSQFVDDDGVVRGTAALTSGLLSREAPSVFPEVLAEVRMQAWGEKTVQRADMPPGSRRGISVETVYADSSFLTVFGYKVIAGTRQSALGTPESVILTESTARALYGNEDPIGRPIVATGLGDGVVGAVIEDPPARSHMQFGMVLPIYPSEENAYWFEAVNNIWSMSYMKLTPDADLSYLESAFRDLFREHGGFEALQPRFMPVTDIHIYSNNQGYNWINANPSSPESLRVLLAIAAGILLIASINFINLTTARSMKRAREVGMRKTLGASRRELIRNYLTETLVMTLIAALIAVLLVEFTAPLLKSLLGKSLGGLFLSSPLVWGVFLAITLLVGLLSGIYPAFVQTSFKPVDVMRGDFRSSGKGVVLRQALVILQFTLSIALISSVLIMRDQIGYVLNMDMGYNREQVIFFDTTGLPEDSRQVFLDRLNSDPAVVAAGAANNTPGPELPGVGITTADDTEWERGQGGQIFEVRGMWFEALKIPMLQGRNFRMDNDADIGTTVILNRAAIDSLGLENPIGETITLSTQGPVTVIGVVENFNFGSARQEIAPAVFIPAKTYSTRIYIRLPAGRIPEGITAVRKDFTDVYGQELFGFRFLDDHFEHQYKADRQFAANAGLFSIFALVIASLGVFGIITFITEQRRREIGVRKVLGSSESGIFWLLSKRLLWWVVLGNVIAIPLSWYLMNLWLGQFASRVTITVVPFVIAGLLTLLVAAVTMTMNTMKAVRINPATVLRAE